MVISHKHKYLFVELPRTGTTAIHHELIKNYDGEEILFKHANYRDFLRLASDEEKEYFVFSCIRNPMDRVVSLFLKLKNQNGQFKNSIYRKSKSLSARYFNKRIRYLQENNASFAHYFKRFYTLPYDDWSSLDHDRFDYVLRFENLNEDFNTLLHKLGIEKVRDLPIINKTSSKENFLKYFTPEIHSQARKVFGPFMEKNGYDFPEDWAKQELTALDYFKYNVWSFVLKQYWVSGLKKPKLSRKPLNQIQ